MSVEIATVHGMDLVQELEALLLVIPAQAEALYNSANWSTHARPFSDCHHCAESFPTWGRACAGMTSGKFVRAPSPESPVPSPGLREQTHAA